MTVSPLASSASTACCTRRRSSSGVSWRPCSRYVTSGVLRMARVRRSSSGRKTSQAMRCISVSFPPGGGVAGAVWEEPPCGGKHGRGGPPLCRVSRRRGFRFASAPFLPYRGVSCGPPPHQSNVLGGGRGPGEGATLLQKGSFFLPPVPIMFFYALAAAQISRAFSAAEEASGV